MTAKEKAAKLVAIYSDFEFNPLVDAKRCAKDCALIAVDEVIMNKPMFPVSLPDSPIFLSWQRMDKAIEYWQQVKNEIEKL